MCEPVSLGILAGGGILTGLAGAGVSAYGQYQQGQATGAALDENAKRTRLAAADVLQRGTAEAGKARMAGSRVIGEEQALAGASGIDPSTGTAAELAGASRAAAELDAKTIANNAAREAWGLKLEAQDLKKQARQAREAGKFGAAGSILGGLGGAASNLYGVAK